MLGVQVAAIFLFLSLGCTEGYGEFRSNFLRSLEDGFRSKRKTTSVAEQIYYQDLLAPFFTRRRSESLSKRSKSNVGDTGCTERSKITYTSPTTATVDVKFPSVHTTKDDTYMCTGYKIPFPNKESFIVKFTPHAEMSQTHHMLVYGCEELASKKPYWDCWEPCKNKKTLYAWARNAPELKLPQDVGFSIGEDSGIKYISVQMHFAKAFKEGTCAGVSAEVTTKPQKYYAGIFLLGAYEINLPPHSSNVPASVACFNRIQDPMHVFGFRTHAHMHANVITGYRFRNKHYNMIGKGNPKWPQSFYPRVGGEIVLRHGDVLTAQCVYNNTENRVIHAGSSGSDEMCNLYLMFYTKNIKTLKQELECWGLPEGVTEKDFTLPSTVGEMPPYPGYAGKDSIQAIAEGRATVPSVPAEHIHQHHKGGDHDEEMEGNHEEEEEKEEEEGEVEREEGFDAEYEPKHPETELESKFAELKSLLSESETLSRSHGMPKYQGLQADLSYPKLQQGYSIGAVGGLVVANDGSVYVFHRAGRAWTPSSFDSHNRYIESNNPIANETLYHLDGDGGSVLHAWGKNQFFMPHGASLDPQGNLWLTDVAMHQVFKFPPEGAKEPLLTLGERMIPGTDTLHFCKPTDVAVDSDGMIYVSDGYCNGRVVKFSPDGSFVKQWGRMATSKELMHPPVPPYVFFVAHNIILCGADQSELCVADREDGRIQCFTKNGELTRVIMDKNHTGSRIFAITYSPLEGGLIYGVSGHDLAGNPATGFTMHYDTGVVMEQWEPALDTTAFDPHDISVSPSGEKVYVGDLTHEKVFKLFQVPSAQEGGVLEDAPLPPPPLDGDNELIDKKSGAAPDFTDQEKSAEDNSEEVGEVPEEPPAPAQDDGGEIIEEVRDFHEGSVDSSGAATIIIICLVALPTVAILGAFVCIRMRARRLREYESLLSSNGKSGSGGKSLNLGKFLKPTERKGFTRVRSEASEDEYEDSDVEVYSKSSGITKKPVYF